MNWPVTIGIAVDVIMRTAAIDAKKVWNYRLPRVRASESAISELEGKLGHKLDPQYRDFLLHANGWPCFFQDVDLFGVAEQMQGSISFENASMCLDSAIEGMGVYAPMRRSDLMLIAGSSTQIDVFAMGTPAGGLAGKVVWIAGDEVDRFEDFNSFFLSMIEYNKIRYKRFVEQGN